MKKLLILLMPQLILGRLRSPVIEIGEVGWELMMHAFEKVTKICHTVRLSVWWSVKSTYD